LLSPIPVCPRAAECGPAEARSPANNASFHDRRRTADPKFNCPHRAAFRVSMDLKALSFEPIVKAMRGP